MRAFCLGVVAAALVTGCGEVPRSRVSGKVTYQGKQLAGVTAIFLAADNSTYPVDLKADGTYEVAGVPRGAVKVSLQQAEGRPGAKSEVAPAARKGGVSAEEAKDNQKGASRMPEPTGNPVVPVAGPRLPAVYADPDKSGLTFDLKEPDQQWSVDLK